MIKKSGDRRFSIKKLEDKGREADKYFKEASSLVQKGHAKFTSDPDEAKKLFLQAGENSNKPPNK